MKNSEDNQSEVDLTLKLGLPDGDGNYITPHDHHHHQNQQQQQRQLRHCSSHIPIGIPLEGMYPNEGGDSNYSNSLSQIFGPFPANQRPNNNPSPGNYYLNNFVANQLRPSTLANYTLLDVPARRAHRDLGCSSAAGRGLRRNYNDPSKRCTNYNCNTNDTPMWRRGPLGPKTLCNACGIKYRKDEEKRRAKEGATASASGGQHPHTNF